MGISFIPQSDATNRKKRRSTKGAKKNWLVTKTNQARKNPPTSLRKFGLALAVENYQQSHLSHNRMPPTAKKNRLRVGARNDD
jgi:hypothetical protein